MPVNVKILLGILFLQLVLVVLMINVKSVQWSLMHHLSTILWFNDSLANCIGQ